MANCRICGKDAGFLNTEHQLCREAKEAHRTLEEFTAERQAAGPKPLTAGGVFGAVLGALCVWSLIMAVVAAFLRAAG
jgi:hypothetical protein